MIVWSNRKFVMEELSLPKVHRDASRSLRLNPSLPGLCRVRVTLPGQQ